MKETVTIAKSVGKYGVNRSSDVATIQTRLNKWIAFGRLPGLNELKVDGQCGPKTKTAIGAFQLRYVMGVTKPDCRCDAGGATVTHMGLDFSEGSKATPGDPVYDGWLKANTDVDDGAPYWQKRGMFWYGVGVKASVGSGSGISTGEWDAKGADLTLAAMYNLKNEDNRFMIAAATRRTINLGGGYSGSVVLCFATGMYFPDDFNKIQSSGADFNLSLAGKWSSFAKWAAKIPKLDKIVSAVQIAKYADGGVVSEVTAAVKGAIAGFDIKEDDTMPSFVAIDIPFMGGGMEASVYYGVTSYQVANVKLT